MTVVVLVAVAVGGWLAAFLVGYLLAQRAAGKPVGAAAEPADLRRPPRCRPPVLDALGTGVVVVDRDERVVLVNPAARGDGHARRRPVGVSDADRSDPRR